jgi:hypothetical protein
VPGSGGKRWSCRGSAIDCAGAVSFDEGGIDFVIEMLENARDNLRRRRGSVRQKR